MPAAPVLDVAQALDNPFVTEHGRLHTVEHPDAGPFQLVAPAIRSAGDPPPANPAPPLGGDTGDILGGLGYDASRIASLRDDGVI